ncbi:MAG: riboflavin biosynthesis protein RibF [Chloroflexi bacterium RBG_13_51_18]|nr:MAG: riboflavin biosynthesis protein RibF [Chloroflexi bacterium RBG_13_51_18]
MLVEEELARFSSDKESVLTIGVFDGVHLGHKQLISELLKQAKSRHMISGVVTFRHNPEKLLSHRNKLPFLTDIEERLKLLKQEGVTMVIPLSFTPELAQLSAREFVTLLQKYLKMRGLVTGKDFALGKEREGDTENLKILGRNMGFNVTIVPPLAISGETVSSTSIRKALAAGDMHKVAVLTGRPFNLTGKVIAGYGRGVSLGFPTANLEITAEHVLPPDGVYAGRVNINENSYQTMINIGKNPTFGVNKRTIEAYLIDYHGDLYGSDLQLNIVSRIREEKKFESIEELKKQVAEDILKGKAILDSTGGRN